MTRPGHFALSAALGAALLVAGATGAFAEDATRREATIMVSGEGQSALAPDTALVTLAVVKQAKSAHDALDENNKAMAAVQAALKESGIAERDMQTSGFSIQPQYVYSNGSNGQSNPPELTGYQANNALSVRIRDLGKLGGLLDQAVSLGINQGGDVQFINDKPDAALTDARKSAVAAARAKAQTLSEAAGVKLGRVIEISENAGPPPPQPMFRAAMMKQASDSAVPVQAGENNYNVVVSITYAIDQ